MPMVEGGVCIELVQRTHLIRENIEHLNRRHVHAPCLLACHQATPIWRRI
jgi:hypothetical protein